MRMCNSQTYVCVNMLYSASSINHNRLPIFLTYSKTITNTVASVTHHRPFCWPKILEALQPGELGLLHDIATSTYIELQYACANCVHIDLRMRIVTLASSRTCNVVIRV